MRKRERKKMANEDEREEKGEENNEKQMTKMIEAKSHCEALTYMQCNVK